jgi:multimeric flavodoxin WrbA
MSENEQKIIGISASPRSGFTDFYIKDFLGRIEKRWGIATQFISLSNRKINPCDGCGACYRKELKKLCKYDDDWYEIAMQIAYPPPLGLIIGSPVYIFNVNSLLLSFLERFTVFHQMIYHPELYSRSAPDWSRTAAGALSVGGSRNGGQEFAIDTILHWFLIHGFTIVGCSPRTAIGASLYEPIASTTVSDERGLILLETMANRIAWTGKALQKADVLSNLPYGHERPGGLDTIDKDALITLKKNLKLG